jgi:hypothetical protein
MSPGSLEKGVMARALRFHAGKKENPIVSGACCAMGQRNMNSLTTNGAHMRQLF